MWEYTEKIVENQEDKTQIIPLTDFFKIFETFESFSRFDDSNTIIVVSKYEANIIYG